MATIDKAYHKLVNKIRTEGYWYDDPYRKGVRRKELATYELKHDLTKGFPAMTTKSLFFRGVVGELIWFLRGWTSPKYLIDNGINIWNKDGAKFLAKQTGHHLSESEYARFVKQDQLVGDLGRIYGAQWRDWHGVELIPSPTGGFAHVHPVDQIDILIKKMIHTPLATDMIVNAWNPAELANMALPPCHFGFQVVGRPLTWLERNDILLSKYTESQIQDKYPEKGARIAFTSWKQKDAYYIYEKENIPKYGFTLIWDQRSVDTFLGLPFNIASYALLAHILGKITNMVPLEIVGSLRNVHIYDNAMDAIKEQMDRYQSKYEDIDLIIKDRPEYDRLRKGACTLDNFLSNLEISDFKLNNYESYPPLKVEMLARD